MAALGRRWRELRAGPWSDEAWTAMAEARQAELSAAAPRNFEVWDVLGGHPGVEPPTWEGDVGRLTAWLTARTAWMDAALAEEPP